MNVKTSALAWTSMLMLACGQPPTSDGSAGDDDGGPTTDPTVGTNPTSGATSHHDGSGSGGGTTGTTGTTSAADETNDDGPPPIKLDQNGIPDAPMFCMQGEGEVEFSYIWIANSSQNTISKINTETLVEEGRYYTRPDLQGNPSRTSVSLTGNVAVANRSGGLTKFYALEENCVDGNGNGTINTSSGPGNLLAWGSEECMAWHTPMNYTSQRPVAWTQGEWDQAACATVNEKVWTSGAQGEAIEVLLVDGDTGIIEETVPIPGVQAGYFGIYGAAVDSEGNFWGSQLGIGWVVRVDRQTMDVQTWPMVSSGYGMTVDQEGYVWTCSSTAARFDPMTANWQTANVGGSGGCMSDGGDILWMASSPLVGINRHTLAVEYSIPLPNYVHGVSIDHNGYVWGVSMNTEAYRVDPQSGTWDVVGGLIGPYTYSDMTGFALNNVGGGGAPSG
ncbi:MAG: hypothetical protein KDK70_15875 [Myxococcales bacterium]|nr:hypothetical protein [Myxococcales bacterium]